MEYEYGTTVGRSGSSSSTAEAYGSVYDDGMGESETSSYEFSTGGGGGKRKTISSKKSTKKSGGGAKTAGGGKSIASGKQANVDRSMTE